jgi:hypothetical protein
VEARWLSTMPTLEWFHGESATDTQKSSSASPTSELGSLTPLLEQSNWVFCVAKLIKNSFSHSKRPGLILSFQIST